VLDVANGSGITALAICQLDQIILQLTRIQSGFRETAAHQLSSQTHQGVGGGFRKQRGAGIAGVAY
jgi:hypothetical protein